MEKRRLKTTLGVGVGLRSPHYPEVLAGSHGISWFEAISENFMGLRRFPNREGLGARHPEGHALPLEWSDGGPPLRKLEAIRRDVPIVLHGVSLSIGSTDPLNYEYLKRLRELHDRIEPAWVSDHLCWTGVEGENLHDLLPLPYTEEALAHVAERILKVEDFLGRPLVVENLSSYITYAHSTLTEWDFLRALSHRTGCLLLLDLNNLYVSSVNHEFSPTEYLNALPKDRIAQIHLAGHSDESKVLIDTHDRPVSEKVWDLYETTLNQFGDIPTLIEWDGKLPEFARLKDEANHAEKIRKKVFEKIL